jgi:hypothetical protein
VTLREDAAAPRASGLVELYRIVYVTRPAPARALVPNPPPRLLVAPPRRVSFRVYAPGHDCGYRRLQRCQSLPQPRILSFKLSATPPVVLELTFKRLAW